MVVAKLLNLVTLSPSGCQSMWVSLRALNWANYVPNYDQRFRITVSLYNLLYYPVNRLELMTVKQYQRRSPWPVHLSYNPICDIIILVVIVKQRNYKTRIIYCKEIVLKWNDNFNELFAKASKGIEG